jgi:hypothetical protein
MEKEKIFRSPRTAAERRAALGFEADLRDLREEVLEAASGGAVRGRAVILGARRKGFALPDVRDGLPRAAERSWKCYRRTRWKVRR